MEANTGGTRLDIQIRRRTTRLDLLRWRYYSPGEKYAAKAPERWGQLSSPAAAPTRNAVADSVPTAPSVVKIELSSLIVSSSTEKSSMTSTLVEPTREEARLLIDISEFVRDYCTGAETLGSDSSHANQALPQFTYAPGAVLVSRQLSYL